MRIKEINWLDIGGEEAVLKVVSDTDCLVCFHAHVHVMLEMY